MILDLLHANWWLLARWVQKLKVLGIAGILGDGPLVGRKGEIQNNLT